MRNPVQADEKIFTQLNELFELVKQMEQYHHNVPMHFADHFLAFQLEMNLKLVSALTTIMQTIGNVRTEALQSREEDFVLTKQLSETVIALQQAVSKHLSDQTVDLSLIRKIKPKKRDPELN
jgi:hypothetical protein